MIKELSQCRLICVIYMHFWTDINECRLNTDGCQGTCSNTEGSYQCGCRSGFRLATDELTCVDFNECGSSNGGCTQICTNTVGSFSCGCESGFQLENDGISCTGKPTHRATHTVCMSVYMCELCLFQHFQLSVHVKRITPVSMSVLM